MDRDHGEPLRIGVELGSCVAAGLRSGFPAAGGVDRQHPGDQRGQPRGTRQAAAPATSASASVAGARKVAWSPAAPRGRTASG